MNKFGRCLALIALVMLCNGHLAVLQTVAWTKMFIDYSQHHSLRVALDETFDGQHPCALCKEIAKQKQSDRQSTALQSSVAKMLLFCEQPTSLLAKLEARETAPILDCATTSRNFPPLLQPPKV